MTEQEAKQLVEMAEIMFFGHPCAEVVVDDSEVKDEKED